MHLQAGALLKNGEYKIEKVLGQGGFGITYLAEQTSLGRKVALKEFFMEGLCNRDAATSHVSVPSVGSKKLVERFKQKFIKEARMIASFDNNHIISIHDVFEENSTAYYVMEYLGGKSLSAIVNEQGIMSETLALKYIRQVADALAEVHANNLLHLDVKPANIMLNKKGEAVLIDFGISKHYDEAGNQTSSALIGTSEGYAPLEQYEAGALDSFTPATDIYALGATLFFLLTGTRPPKAGDVMNDGLPELPSEISQTASCAITAAMQPRRKDRPQSIAEFLCLVESGKMQDESDGETELNGNEEVERRNEKEHSAGAVISNEGEKSHSADAVISNEGEKSHSAGIEILPPYSRQNDKDGKKEAERRNEKEHSAGAVISNESEKSQKNKPGKSLLLILLLLLVAVAGAWFLFGGTGSGDAPKTDTKKQIEKKDTPKEAGNTTDGNKASESSTGSGIDKEENVNATAVASNNNEEVKNFKENGICYNVIDNVNKRVEVAKGGEYTGSIVIPETVVHNAVIYSVTGISREAFYGCTGLTSIKIPNSVTSIVDWAFYGCSGLTSVTIPNSVTSIGACAFDGCEGLTSINIPNSVTNIGGDAFSDCSGLTSITIPNSVTSIECGAFSGCTSFTSIIVDKNNPKYDSRDNCNAIIETETNELIAGCKNTIIPDNVTSIGDWAFSGCTGLTSITIPNSVTSIGDEAFSDCSGLTSVTIPNSVTSIGGCAFSDCSGLTSINIPNSVTSIGQFSFCRCTGLTSITIPNRVTSIGYSAFDDCSGLTSIIVDKKNPKYDSRYNCNAIIETETNRLIVGCKNTVIPGNVTSIGRDAFNGCEGLTSITIPNSVTSIEHGAFEDCSGLTSIIVDKNNPKYDSRDNCNAIIETKTNELIAGCKNTVIPGNVTSIGWGAFWGCSGLTSITIPNSVTSIGRYAFDGCEGLTSITIPNSVTSIGTDAFRGCVGLENVIKPDGIGKDAFKGTPWLKKQK